VELKTGVRDKVHNSTSGSNHLSVCSACNHPQEDLFHIFVFIPGPLRNQRYSFLEVAKGRVPCHALEAAIDFITSFVYCCCASTDEMILEDSFMELVMNIGGETLEYIGMG
jgi:hypothetical protein